jgi:bacillithiol biosynthesis deacetylase BshB1
MPTDPERLDVLAFGAHPDDAEAACGGLLAKLAQRGYRVAICDLTRGELGSNGTPAERAAEAREAAAVLGVHERLGLELPDGALDGGDAGQIAAVVRLLRRRAPRLIIGPHARSRHPDHAEAARLLHRAQFFCAVGRFAPEAARVERPVLLRALDWEPMPDPSFVVDIGACLALKLAALRCYRTQFERRPGRVATVLNDPAYLRRVEVNAATYGQLIGAAAGEPYRIDGGVPVDDPVAYFAGGDVQP